MMPDSGNNHDSVGGAPLPNRRATDRGFNLLARIERGLLSFAAMRQYAEIIARQTRRRASKPEIIDPNPSVSVRVTTAVLAILILGGLIGLSFATTLGRNTHGGEAFLNLTTAGHQWEVHYGDSPRCADRDCFLVRDHPAMLFERRQVLPSREFPLSGWEKGQNIYYRTTVALPEQLAASPEPFVLYTLYVWAERYEVWVNGHLLTESGRGSLWVSIPTAVRRLVPGMLDIAIKVNAGQLPYQGIANKRDLLLGPESALAPFRHELRDTTYSHYLALLLPQFTLTFLFGCFALFVPSRRETTALFTFGIFTAGFILMAQPEIMVWIEPGLGLKIAHLMRPLQGLALMWFVAHFFRFNDRRIRLWLMVTSLLVFGVTLFAVTSGIFPGYFSVVGSLKRACYGIAIAFGLFASVSTALYLRVYGLSEARRRISWLMAFFFLLAGCGLAYDMFFEAMRFEMSVDHMFFLALAFTTAVELGYIDTQRHVARGVLTRHMDAQIAEKLLNSPDSEKGEERPVTVVFADLRGFTSLTESRDPQVVISILNQYFELVVTMVRRHGGIIDSFGGDSVMAFWVGGATEAGDASSAVEACLEIRQGMAVVNQSRVQSGEPPINIGMGVCSGNAIVGSIGSKDRRQYTVIGDAVNTAARVQDLTKSFHTDILVHERTYELVREGFPFELCEPVEIRGKTSPQRVARLPIVKHSNTKIA